MATEIISKRCSKCKEIKPLSEFYKNRKQYDGLQTCCKSCNKAYLKAYRQRGRGKAADAKYRKTPKGKVTNRKRNAKRNALHPNFVKAVDAVNNAIKCGRLPRADTRLCHYCPNPARQYHHWHGYEPEHWLDVVPACVECHKKEHRKIA